MIRKVASIICYCVGGFFLYGINMISFFNTNTPPNGKNHIVDIIVKLIVIVLFLIPALFFLIIGLALRGFQKWKYDVAFVLLSAAAFSVFTVFSMICMFLSPEYAKLFPASPIGLINNYFTGISCALIFIAIGLLLLFKEQRKLLIK